VVRYGGVRELGGVFALAFGCAAMPAQAQQIFGPGQERPPLELPPRAPQAPPLELPPVQAPTPQDSLSRGLSVFVRAFAFEGSTVFTADELARAAGAVTALRRVRLCHAGAVIPDQSVDDGVVTCASSRVGSDGCAEATAAAASHPIIERIKQVSRRDASRLPVPRPGFSIAGHPRTNARAKIGQFQRARMYDSPVFMRPTTRDGAIVRWAAVVGVGLGVGAAVCAARAMGWLEWADLRLYDAAIAARAGAGEATAPITLVRIREEEIHRHGHPMPDAILARALEQLVVKRLPGPMQAGIHVVDLAQQGIQLEEGTTYDWYVALVLDPKARDADVVAGGAIQRRAATPELTAELKGGDPSYRVLARNGIWYDAIADLSAAVASAPNGTPAGRALHAERAALLEQVGVGAAALYEREGGG
jgi:Domain of Unknown Function (DUF928)/CHASE2 domain